MDALLRELIAEIAARPAQFIAEAVQAVLLLGVVAWLGRRWARKRLGERRNRIAADLAEADAADKQRPDLVEQARSAAAQAEREAPELLRAGQEQAAREREAMIAGADTEARELVAQARRTVQAEKDRISREASDRLAHLTTEVTRRYLDEMLNESERRTLTQKAILASLGELERIATAHESGAL
jgi:F0F1-type ATP synthase membrane subunit b/b'